MTEQEIIASAPPSASYYGMKLAFCCSKCTWWTNDPRRCKAGEKKRAECPECFAPCQNLPLEVLIESTKARNPDHFDAFIQAFDKNRRGAP